MPTSTKTSPPWRPFALADTIEDVRLLYDDWQGLPLTRCAVRGLLKLFATQAPCDEYHALSPDEYEALALVIDQDFSRLDRQLRDIYSRLIQHTTEDMPC